MLPAPCCSFDGIQIQEWTRKNYTCVKRTCIPSLCETISFEQDSRSKRPGRSARASTARSKNSKAHLDRQGLSPRVILKAGHRFALRQARRLHQAPGRYQRGAGPCCAQSLQCQALHKAHSSALMATPLLACMRPRVTNTEVNSSLLICALCNQSSTRWGLGLKCWGDCWCASDAIHVWREKSTHRMFCKKAVGFSS